MAKIISKGHLPKDHPIYTGRWVFSPSASGFKRPEKKEDTQKKKGRARPHGGSSTGTKTGERQ